MFYDRFTANFRNVYWTYKNSLIELTGSQFWTRITYFDRKMEEILGKQEKETELLLQEAEKRRADSVARVNKEQEEIERQNRIKQEENHKKSIIQI